MDNRTDYNNASLVEIFLNRAFKFDQRIIPAHLQEFLNLINAENGNRLSILPTYEKQLDKMKEQLTKAVRLLSKQKIDSANKEKLIGLLAKIEAADSSDELFKASKAGLEYTQSLID